MREYPRHDLSKLRIEHAFEQSVMSYIGFGDNDHHSFFLFCLSSKRATLCFQEIGGEQIRSRFLWFRLVIVHMLAYIPIDRSAMQHLAFSFFDFRDASVTNI